MKKKLCLLIYNLGSGGAEHVISQWSFLLSKEYEVFMTVFDGHTEPNYEYFGKLYDLDVISNNRNVITKTFGVLKRAYKLHKFVKENKIDIVVSFCNECNLANTLSLHNAVKVCSIRSVSDIYANRYVKYVIQSKKNSIIIQTDALREILINEYGAQVNSKLSVIGNPFDIDSIQSKAREKVDEKLIDILENKKTIVNVASFKAPKNHVNLLRSFELVCKNIDDVYLIMIGADSGGIYKKLKELSLKSDYADRIIFAGEYKNPFPIVSKSSVFVLSSLAEGIPNALAEAMICGLPVISSNCPTGPEELLTGKGEDVIYNDKGYFIGKYGILVKPFSKEDAGVFDYNCNLENQFLANAICDVLLSEPLRNELKERSYNWTKQNNLDNYRESLEDLINSYCIDR